MWFKKRKKVLVIWLVLGVAVSDLFGQDSVLRDQIKLKDSVYYYKDKSDHIDIPTPTPTYYKDSAKCPNDPITYLNNNMKPFNGIDFYEYGDIGYYINKKKMGYTKNNIMLK